MPKFLCDIAEEGNCCTRPELDIHKKVMDRADTIDAFNKAVANVESSSRQASVFKGENHFLFKCPATFGDR